MFDLKAFREQPLPTQAQIISQWQGDSTSPLVSVICTAYNQENYIEDALKGFLMQKTSFPFEIIIHDDASTDKTADIINDYAKKYPLIIKPILQKDNQYSINGHLPLLNTIAVASGQYLALCEGDDFWIDEFKVSKQVAVLKNSKIKICFTPAIALSSNSKIECVAKHSTLSSDQFTSSDIINGGGSFMPTASLMIKATAIKKLPDWFSKAPVGDYYLQVIASAESGAAFLLDTTVVYRTDAGGSWSSKRQIRRTKMSILNEQAAHCYCIKELMKSYPKYSKEFQKVMAYFKAQASFDLIMNKYFIESQNMIKESWLLYPQCNKLQSILYKLRSIPFFTYVSAHLKRVLISDSLFK